MNNSILYFDEIDLQDATRVGNKNAALGEILQKLSSKGISVPDGFVISSKIYQDFLSQNNLKQKIADIIKRLDTKNFSNLSEIGKTIRSTFQKSTFSYLSQVQIIAAYNELLERVESDGSVIVRCSAITKSTKNNFAKQLDCYLNIKGENALLEACKNCFVSLYSDKALKYCILKEINPTDVGFSVGVQQMIHHTRKDTSQFSNLNKKEQDLITEWSAIINEHFQTPMTIEWVKDEVHEQVYLIQAYPKAQNMRSFSDNFYEAIGYLCYAISAADRKVKLDEIKVLKKILTEDWLPQNHPSEAILKIQIVFEKLINQNLESDAAMIFFKLFKESHNELFTPDTKELIWKTVNSIAEAVAGKNKSELVLLSKLNTILS